MCKSGLKKTKTKKQHWCRITTYLVYFIYIPKMTKKREKKVIVQGPMHKNEETCGTPG